VFSSTKLEIRAEQVLPGSEVGVGGERVGLGAGGRNDPNNACTCEYMNNNNNKKTTNISETTFLVTTQQSCSSDHCLHQTNALSPI
jgi:hypothetical protein